MNVVSFTTPILKKNSLEFLEDRTFRPSRNVGNQLPTNLRCLSQKSEGLKINKIHLAMVIIACEVSFVRELCIGNETVFQIQIHQKFIICLVVFRRSQLTVGSAVVKELLSRPACRKYRTS
jgi:hypothetical protein